VSVGSLPLSNAVPRVIVQVARGGGRCPLVTTGSPRWALRSSSGAVTGARRVVRLARSAPAVLCGGATAQDLRPQGGFAVEPGSRDRGGDGHTDESDGHALDTYTHSSGRRRAPHGNECRDRNCKPKRQRGCLQHQLHHSRERVAPTRRSPRWLHERHPTASW
jgi:hypothetical protein